MECLTEVYVLSSCWPAPATPRPEEWVSASAYHERSFALPCVPAQCRTLCLWTSSKCLWCPEGHEVTHWTLLHMLWLQEANASVHLGLSLLPNI